MVVKLTNLTLKSANINRKFKINETLYEYFNTNSKHFVGSRNPFLFVFVLIIALALLNSTKKMRRLGGGGGDIRPHPSFISF